MLTGAETTQPIGHYEMCEATPRECGRTPRADPIPMTPATWALLDSVNRSVNASIRAVTDIEHYGELEVWAYPTTAGDCEDFVLLKRRLLQQAGWPLSDLLITMVFQANGEGHAVLTVRTDQGDYVLDNTTDEVRLWWETGYRFVKRQSERDAGSWVAIRQVTASPPVAVVQIQEGFGPIGGP
ncbi:MAG: transglutaminase-like cysteine peptidase [Bauldia sp.]